MNKQAGFSLMEVLITILLVSIGLLGYAALQMGALNSSLDSFSRSQASIILEDAAARIRNNSEYLKSDMGEANVYVGDLESKSVFQWCNIENGITPEAICDVDSSCSMSDLAKQDIYEVCSSLIATKIPTGVIGASCFDREADSDNCSYGSRMSLFLAWRGTEREDISGKDKYAQNTRCQTELDLDSDYACVQLELVP
ncbi:type IV pilus modification protein PilV [Kangiella sp.]|uniref:type IV pilus modification protein PilV n=1 Tax=Kangiella sp. TaxID=1920245 RepID=UPI00198E160A|nr:type IV pilus modification protein PilV [Kangiella sp.]MBD3653678.1 type IV pilus modification protein PilV [Kangiella sp.]